MRIQCPRCQDLAEVRRFTTTSDPPRIEFLCPVCGEQVSQEAEAKGSSEDNAASAPGGVAPESSWSKAPLGVSAGVAPGVASQAPKVASQTSGPGGSDGAPPRAPGDPLGSDVLWNLWDRVTDDFTDQSGHDAFIAACEVAGSLPYAAARYREWADSHPEDSVARDRLGRIATLAQMKVLLSKERRAREKDPLRQAMVLGFVMLLIIAVVVMTAPLVFRGVTDRTGESPTSRGRSGAAGAPEPQLQNLRRPSPPSRGPQGLSREAISPPGEGLEGGDAGVPPTRGQ